MVSIGDKSRMNLKDLGCVVGFYDVDGQSGYPRNVVTLEQIMDAPSDDDIRTVVESARDEALSEDRRRDLVADCELWGFISSLDERLDVPAHALWVSHLGLALLSHLPEFHVSMMMLCLWILCQYHHPRALC